mmetsp:Transcript_11930/g.15647  ORF Transcript_11930/g.15647 Transcript_11930/m.15647 type:complete len:229 (+) Transcript_11930:105-791(+)|eukprot:CAMPEP_0198146164 /NCGR_PEP_ID=MMETSP1443-20131203/27828_1 /TAXON_ID=186043 /ORGANISM="Entomoneis sp., Strain CCMP2396" /LENGTH=228 /DNA_ID=CAMNT_0043810025 /DNA_START=94 /DNA_END=780 /DNA_ORIENTATION=-
MTRSIISVIAALAIFTVGSDAFAFVPRSRSLVAPKNGSTVQMKVFDWKRREADESSLNDLENTQFTVTNLKPAPGSRPSRTRKGRGIAAGQGATCGFGMRGQKSRAGSGTRPGFEGGQQPLYRRLPKFVGKPTGPGHTKTMYNPISTDVLSKVDAGSTVSFDSLFESKIITKSKFGLHKFVKGSDAVSGNLTVKAHGFTASAREAIESSGGNCELLSPTTGEVLEPVV